MYTWLACYENGNSPSRQAQALVSYIYLFTIYVYPWTNIYMKQVPVPSSVKCRPLFITVKIIWTISLLSWFVGLMVNMLASC